MLRPPYGPGESALTTTNDWLVLKPARLAVLDEHFVRQLAEFRRWPGGCSAGPSSARASSPSTWRSSTRRASTCGCTCCSGTWPSRWGRVRSDGVVIPLRLTHAVLSDLVAARRPTVTSALSDLSRRGEVRIGAGRVATLRRAPGDSARPGIDPGARLTDLPAPPLITSRPATCTSIPYIVLGSAHHRPARRHDRSRRRRADDADADPAVRGQALDGDLLRSRRRGADAPVRRRRPHARRHRQLQARQVDGDRLGAGGVRRAAICCT